MDNKQEEVIYQLSKLFKLLNNNKKNIESEHTININTLCAHGTNGFVALLALLTGQTLLPSKKRKKKGIPTISGEKIYKKKEHPLDPYHQEYQNFVSTVPLHVPPSLCAISLALRYAKNANTGFLHGYDVFNKKFSKLLSGQDKIEFFNKIDEKALKQLYEKLTHVEILILGNGIGYAHEVRSMPDENRYEKVKIRAIIVNSDDLVFFEKIFSIIGVQDIALIDRASFGKFLYCERKKTISNYISYAYEFVEKFVEKFKNYNIQDITQDDECKKFFKLHGYDDINEVFEKYGSNKIEDFSKEHFIELPSFAELFIHSMRDKFSLNFGYGNKPTPIHKKKTYKKGKEYYEKDVSLIYSELLETPAPHSVKNAIASKINIFSVDTSNEAKNNHSMDKKRIPINKK